MHKPEFVYVTYIETTPEKLWEALTSSEFTRRYWWETDVVSDWKVGSPFSLVMKGVTTDVGEILQSDPPHRLSYTFQHVTSTPSHNARPSTVRFNLEQHGKLVKLTLTHRDFADDDRLLDGISKGWPAIMSSLKSLLERGAPLHVPLAALEIEGVK
jgi:uncharacterized protein YndB with AHSA1/START domain